MESGSGTYVFYDVETSGLSPEFDQIFQFAAVVTDADFNEIDTVDIRVKRRPHIVPAFGALRTTGVDPLTIDRTNFTTYDLASQLTEMFEGLKGATFIGYNSIRFDENFLRHLFYQNLRPIYQTQTGGNGRLDCLNLVSAALATEPSALTFEINDKGRPNRRLESLAPLNGYAEHNAHDALGDVRATIHITKVIRQRCPELWRQYQVSRTKHLFEDTLLSNTVVEVVNGFGKRRIISPICYAQGNQGFICFDHETCRATPELGAQDWLQNFGKKKQTVFFRQRANTAEYISPVKTGILPDGLSAREFEQTMSVLKTITANSDAISDLQLREFESRRQFEMVDVVESKIYGGFPSAEDQRHMRDFHDVAPPDKVAVISQIEDVRFKSLGIRLMAENWPAELTPEKLSAYSKWCADRAFSSEFGSGLLGEASRAREIAAAEETTGAAFAKSCVRFYDELLAGFQGQDT